MILPELDLYPDGTSTFGARTIVFNGVPGAGPTKFLYEANSRGYFPEGTDIARVGNMIFDELVASDNQLPGTVKTKHDMKDQLDPNLVRSGLRAVLERVGSESGRTGRLAMVDAQVVFEEGGQLFCEADLYRRLDPLGYVFIWKDPEQIRQRREQQMKTPDRPIQTADEIRVHQRESLSMTLFLAKLTGAKLLVLYNTSEEQERNLNRIRNFVQTVEGLSPKIKTLRRLRTKSATAPL
jgi:adenylate kinase